MKAKRPNSLPPIAATTLMILGGIVLYVPAAIGMLITEAFRPRADDAGWRFDTEALRRQTPANQWARMKPNQYFRIVPGVTALDRRNRAVTLTPAHG